MTPKLAISNLDAFYGRAQILSGVALEARAGEATALLGRNGAGKTTTFRSVMGLVPRRSGSIRFDGIEILGWPTHEIARAGLGYAPEDRRIFTDLTVEENLEAGRQAPRPGAPNWTAERVFALFPDLSEMRKRPGGRMSGGEQKMLTIARTLMGNPTLLLLDEPSEGLAPKIVERIAAAIVDLKRQGLAIVVSEQNLRFARLVCDRAAILEKGRLRFVGSFAELEARPDLRDAYLAI